MARWRKSAEETAEPPAVRPTEQPAEQPVEQPVEKPVEKKEAPVAKTAESKPAKEPKASRESKDGKESKGRKAGAVVVAGTNAIRSRIATLVWLVAVVCALFLAVGALLIALKANKDNAVVSFVLGGADTLDLGVFSRKQGIFTFDGGGAAIKNALVNWGIGAVAYLVVGKVLDRIIRP